MVRYSAIVTLSVTTLFLGTAEAVDHHRPRVSVAPVDEITLIDPGTNAEGKPQPVIQDGQVDIPPTIVVLNYYYTGDRNFRGPTFTGGPSILVVEHPQTGERLYLDLQLLPGSPRVFYRRHWIAFRYPDQTVKVQFCNPLNPLHRHEPIVKYCKGHGGIHETLNAVNPVPGVHQWIERTGAPEAVESVAGGTKTLLFRTADGIRKVGETATTPIKLVKNSTIIGSLFESSPEEEATRARDAAVTRAQQEIDSRNITIPTLR